ncbi:STAS domain-containing protein [Planosporangium thailandense]|uniref:STAS domain-containing protein n=1 Tax=Planosporangium thailandense TaxID=765197 RepID=A0ABX0XV06_9ACTN|nr:MEDS domain-containing protein [Planosporangium thailandense]NJC69114.1 STAS domain-containing protein [Planosporangium thailandense]
MVSSSKTRQVRKVRLGDHLCLPFSSDDEQREVLTTYIVDGLARGERVIYYADQTAPDMIGSWLADSGVETGRMVDEGRLEIRPINNNYLFDGRFEPDVVITTLWVEVRQARDAGYPGLRISGEMTSDLRPVADERALVDFEHRLARAFHSRELAAICQYDQRVFDPSAVTGMIACHPQVVQIDPLHDDHRMRIVPTYLPRGLKIIGNIDVMTVGAFTTTLRLANRWPVQNLHLNLSELEFIDVAGVRAIVHAAADLAPGRHLVIEQLAPGLRKVFEVVGWDRTPGLRFTDEAEGVGT